MSCCVNSFELVVEFVYILPKIPGRTNDRAVHKPLYPAQNNIHSEEKQLPLGGKIFSVTRAFELYPSDVVFEPPLCNIFDPNVLSLLKSDLSRAKVYPVFPLTVQLPEAIGTVTGRKKTHALT